MGIKIKIVKISTDNMNKKVIIPALVIPGKKPRLGVNEIKILFENNKKSFNEHRKIGNPGKTCGSYTDFGNYAGDNMLSRFYYDEMMNFDKGNDKEESPTGEALTDDFGRRVSAQLSRRGIDKTMGDNNFQEQPRQERKRPDNNVAIYNEPTPQQITRQPDDTVDNFPGGLPTISPRDSQYDPNKDYGTISKGTIPSDDIFESRFLEYSGL